MHLLTALGPHTPFAFYRPWGHLRRIVTVLILLTVAAAYVAPIDRALAQTPWVERPDRSGINRLERLGLGPQRSEDLRLSSRPLIDLFQPESEKMSANLFTRAGAGLTGLRYGSSASLGDIDGDGNTDLVITGEDANRVHLTTLYLGDGRGGFTETAAGLTGVDSGSSSLGDVNGDGALDLVVTGEDANGDPTATLYLGDGQGGFTETNAGLLGVESSSSSLGDINGDGALDLVITGRDANGDATATLYLGDGQGGFTETNAGLLGVYRSSSSLSDIDGDGDLDLIITGADEPFGSTATLYLGDGQGEFTEANAVLTGVFFGSSSLGDVDGNGTLDLVITGVDANFNRTATLYLGDGQGGFTETNAGLLGVESSSSSLGDIDGDGDLDLVITGEDVNRIFTATVYLGDGQGGFTETNAGLTGVEGGSSPLGDVDGDGDLDLVVTGRDALFGTSASARVYMNRMVQEAPNQSPVVVRTSEGGVVAPGRTITRIVEAGDPDGDALLLTLTQGGNTPGVSLTDVGNGIAGLFFSPSVDQAGQSFTFTVEANDGNGGIATKPITVHVGDDFEKARAVLTGVRVGSSSLLGDVDSDGILDLVITGQDAAREPTATVYIGDGQGAFTDANAGLTGVLYSSSSQGDVDGNGALDLVITGEDANGDPTATLYLNDGQGGFTETAAGLTGVDNGSSSLGDVNGDEALDLVITGEDTNFRLTATLYLGDGQGGFTETAAGLTGVDNGSSSLGDINGDGALDLVITGRDANGDATATLYLGDVQGGFTETAAGLTGVDDGSSSLGDVNGDGALDLVITGEDPHGHATATLYLGDGQGGFTETATGLTGVVSGSSSLGDINGDGDLDLVITGLDADANFNRTATLYLGDGQGGFVDANAGLIGVRGEASLGDIDNNGTLDLVITGQDANFTRTATLYENLLPRDFRVAVASQVISGNGLVNFASTGASVNFSGTSGSGKVTVQRFENRPRLPLGIREANVSSDRFVISAAGNLALGNSTELRLGVSTLIGIDEPSNVTVYTRTIRGEGLFQAVPTSYDAGAGELVAEVGGFSEFALASDSEPLPVELVLFEALATGGGVRLTWRTVSETGNAGFAIERRVQSRASGNGAWTIIGSVDGAGTTNEPQRYRFVDADLPYEADQMEYRLRQIDIDGTESLSQPVIVRQTATTEINSPYPNPARGHVTLKYAVPPGEEMRLVLYDVLGRRIYTIASGEGSGRVKTQINTGGLASGTYFLRLVTRGKALTQQLTITR